MLRKVTVSAIMMLFAVLLASANSVSGLHAKSQVGHMAADANAAALDVVAGDADKVDCDLCNGTGKMNCPNCNAEGTVACTHCLGTGFQINKGDVKSCPHCSGSGKQTCRRCNGAQQITCTKCLGRGTVKNTG